MAQLKDRPKFSKVSKFKAATLTLAIPRKQDEEQGVDENTKDKIVSSKGAKTASSAPKKKSQEKPVKEKSRKEKPDSPPRPLVEKVVEKKLNTNRSLNEH
ncbi:hypothetical protein [Sediminibacillus halophilus]|uniref:hypothetical protein n=1 Tax=Sediminibacillus halophilus TaxID=482461 RepID=UPI0009458588|nr:hypothetical protein [Sediminibacillus halophilus]